MDEIELNNVKTLSIILDLLRTALTAKDDVEFANTVKASFTMLPQDTLTNVMVSLPMVAMEVAAGCVSLFSSAPLPMVLDQRLSKAFVLRVLEDQTQHIADLSKTT